MSDSKVEMTPTLESWRSDRENIFDRFMEEIAYWSQNGNEPFDGGQDMRFCLDLEEKRLKDRGIDMHLDLEASGAPAMQTGKVLGGVLNKYNRNTHYRSAVETLSFSRKGKEIYSHKKDVTFYASIIEPDEGKEGIEKLTYSCPSCGAATTVGELTEKGCPYCGTQFMMKDLFPKVVNYYTMETVPAPEKIEEKARRYPLIGAIGGASLALIMGIFAGYLKQGIGGIFQLVFIMAVMAGMGAFILYLLYSLSLLGRLFKMLGKSLPMLPALGSDKKLDESLSQYDPAFSVEYFSAKAMSLFRAIVFSEEPSKLSFYEGGEIDGRFKRLVHSTYKGGVGVSSIKEEDGLLKVDLDLYLTDYYDEGEKIKAKEEKLKMRIVHKKEFKVDDSFSITAVRCKGCGGSFKAMYQKSCPYCGKEYDLALEDWEAVSIV